MRRTFTITETAVYEFDLELEPGESPVEAAESYFLNLDDPNQHFVSVEDRTIEDRPASDEEE